VVIAAHVPVLSEVSKSGVLAAAGGLRADTEPVLGAGFEVALADARAGDQGAFAAIFRDIQPSLLRYLQVIASDAADDVAGDTWLQVIAGLGGFRGDEQAFRAWLFTIARHRAVDWARSRERRQALPGRLGAAGRGQVAPDTADVVLERLSTHAVVAAIAALPGDQAEIIMLRVVAGLDAPAVAAIVGKTPGAVRVAAHRGLRRLAAVLEQTGVTV
jgi:RNA polymerase sigma-70 factor, ECF subfamily